MSANDSTVRLEPWGPGDRHILERTLAVPEMMTYLGGPESAEKLVERQQRFERLADSGTGRMFVVVDATTNDPVGSVGYWDKTWQDEEVYEIGWMVMREFQGRGIGAAATALAIERARADGKHRFLHAYPSVENAPSNAICRKLTFELWGEHEFEYPPGTLMRCNDWRLDLRER